MSTWMAYGPAVGGGSPTARLVHDLRAPLTVIRGLCESLGRGPAGESTVAGLRLIDAEVDSSGWPSPTPIVSASARAIDPRPPARPMRATWAPWCTRSAIAFAGRPTSAGSPWW
mgnify:CR=1 FL=1